MMLPRNASRPATAGTVGEPRKTDQLGRQIKTQNIASPNVLQAARFLVRAPMSQVRAELVAQLAFGEARP